jgi:parallel beta-helix repeat protein
MAANNTLPLTQTLTISFSIPISDTAYDSTNVAWTISVGSVDGTALPPLARGNVQVDASTQPGGGDHPRIVLDGYIVYEAAGANNGLTITSSNNVVRGLAVANFFDYGILLSGASAANNQVSGCYIGTDAHGGSEQPNGTGVRIEAGAHDNTIGGATPADRNLISGNTLYIVGVWITDPATVNNVVTNNWIGVDASGQAALANNWAGVYVSNGAHDNQIGGIGQGNLISGNERGVYLDSRAASTIVAGNTIGVAADGRTALGNRDGGVFIAHGAHDNRIGGATSGAGNIISGNGVNPSAFGQGVYISDPNTTANTIQGNYIGVDASGNFPAGNIKQGVLITLDAQNNSVGGTDPGTGNVIAYNGLGGIRVDAPSNQIAGNLIGVGANRTTALGNQQNGVRIFGDANVVGPDNLIANNYHSGIMTSGSNTTIISNTLSGNVRSGICVAGAGTTIRGNLITSNGGTNGSWPDCNIQGGVVITGTSDTEVVNNSILGNHGAGITVRGGLNNRILANSISENSTVGILLLEGGNDNIPPPSIGRATPSAIRGTACGGCHIEIFTDSSNQGRDLIGMMTAAPDGSFSLAPPFGTLQPRHVTATNTDRDGNTSSFAAAVEVMADAPPSPNRIYLPIVMR